MNSSGMTSSLKNESSPFQRSISATSAHSIPAMPNSRSRTGRPPAAVVSSRRSSAKRSVGTSTASQTMTNMLVAEVDHGSDIATATASASSARVSSARLKNPGLAGVVIGEPAVKTALLAAPAGMQQPHDDVGILLAPAAKVGVESVDAIEIGSPNSQIARPRAAP